MTHTEESLIARLRIPHPTCEPILREAAEALEKAELQVKQAEPIPASILVTMYAENPTGDADMIEFAREVERAHGIGAAPPAVQAEPVLLNLALRLRMARRCLKQALSSNANQSHIDQLRGAEMEAWNSFQAAKAISAPPAVQVESANNRRSELEARMAKLQKAFADEFARNCKAEAKLETLKQKIDAAPPAVQSIEQRLRDALEAMGSKKAQTLTAGDLLQVVSDVDALPAVRGEPVALDRWGIKSVPGRPEDYWFEKMPDGYWTPWHIANEALQRAEKAKAECDRLSKDAKRYRWLRARAYKDGATICCHGPDGCYDKYAIGDLCEALDAAIDAALKDQP